VGPGFADLPSTHLSAISALTLVIATALRQSGLYKHSGGMTSYVASNGDAVSLKVSTTESDPEPVKSSSQPVRFARSSTSFP